MRVGFGRWSGCTRRSKCCCSQASRVQNISAPFICAVPPFKATLDKAIGMADFVFGNETEAAAFAVVAGAAKANGGGTGGMTGEASVNQLRNSV